MSNISVESRLLNWLGSVFIGKPSALGLPENFYWLPGERGAESSTYGKAEAVRKLVAVTTLRRMLAKRVGYVSAALAAVICVAGVFLQHGLQDLAAGQRVIARQDENKAAWCAQMRATDPATLTPQQRATLATQCN